MNARRAAAAGVVAVAGFLLVAVVVTELASSAVAFSLFLGLPAGVVGGVALGALTYLTLGTADPRRRRVGVGLAAFAVVFLASLGGLVAFGLRNSQALPLAGGAGVVAAVVAVLRVHQGGV